MEYSCDQPSHIRLPPMHSSGGPHEKSSAVSPIIFTCWLHAGYALAFLWVYAFYRSNALNQIRFLPFIHLEASQRLHSVLSFLSILVHFFDRIIVRYLSTPFFITIRWNRRGLRSLFVFKFHLSGLPPHGHLFAKAPAREKNQTLRVKEIFRFSHEEYIYIWLITS